MIIANNKPIRIIGYKESSMTHEFEELISVTTEVVVLEPQEYFDLHNKDYYQYIVASWIDLNERKKVIDHVDLLGLDLITYIHDTSNCSPKSTILPGTFIFPFCNVSLNSTIGGHCIICPYTSVGHYVKIGRNCIFRPGVMINGKSQLGENCILNTRSTITNGAIVCDDVELSGFSAITKNITQSGRYAGTPARRIGAN